MGDFTESEVDAWTLRCMFNWSKIVKRQRRGEFSLIRRAKANLSKKPNHPKDTRSQWMTFRDGNGNEIATAHCYECPTGFVTPIDPKSLRIGQIRYVIHPDENIANPEYQYEEIWKRRVYGLAMKLKCLVFGPVAVLP